MHYEPFLPYLRYIMGVISRYTICCLLLLFCKCIYAQQPSGSLLPENPYYDVPVLKPGESVEDKLTASIFIKVAVSKNTVFTGEPFLAEYKLYRAINSEPSPGKEPSFSGCSVLELPPINEPYTEVLNGKRYYIVVLRKIQLTPLQDGPLVLNEASINNIVQLRTADDPSQVKNFSFIAKSQPVTVTIKPLPEKDKPADFSGLVGNFSISARLDSNTIPAGDNTHLTVTIKGTGNMASINVPAINWPANTEHFDPSDTQRTSQDAFPSRGDKIFDIPFIGTKQGVFVIPPISFSYFDPVVQKYNTVHSDSLKIQFTGPLPKEQQKEIITEDITNRKYLWIVPAIALTVTFVLIISGRNQRRERRRQQAKKQLGEQKPAVPVTPIAIPQPRIDFKMALQELAEIEDDHIFFNKSRELLTTALQKRLNTTTRHEAEILEELQLKDPGSALFEPSGNIYRICNQCLYTPIINQEERTAVYEGLTIIIVQLEE